MTTEVEEVQQVKIDIPKPHSEEQREFVSCVVKRQINKSGRRWGKTVGAAIKALIAFLGVCPQCYGEGCSHCDNLGHVEPVRVLYAAPTHEQVTKFWFEVTRALEEAIDAGVFVKNETERYIEKPGTELRLQARTAWNANTLRGGYWGLIIFEEFQIMNEDAWTEAGQPMLIDQDGTAVFIFTPPSLKSEGVSKAKDPRHASKLFKKALTDTTGRWKTFHFTTYQNPLLNEDALKELTESGDMSADTYRREIMAEDDDIETSWLVYSKFDEGMCKIKRFEIPDNWTILSGHDFGPANPAALFVAQVKLPLPPNAPPYLRYGDYVCFAEYAPGAGYSTAQHIDRFREIAPKCSVSVGGNVTSEEEIRVAYRNLGWRIKAPLITRVNAQIDRGIALFENKQFYILEDLYGLLGEIADCMWIVDEDKRTTNKIRDEARYHLLSCYRYLVTILAIKSSFEKKAPKSYIA